MTSRMFAGGWTYPDTAGVSELMEAVDDFRGEGRIFCDASDWSAVEDVDRPR